LFVFVFIFIVDRYLNGMDGNTDTTVIYDENTSKHKEGKIQIKTKE